MEKYIYQTTKVHSPIQNAEHLSTRLNLTTYEA